MVWRLIAVLPVAGQELDFVPKHAWRGLCVVRLESTSAGIQHDWIAWQEIPVVAARR